MYRTDVDEDEAAAILNRILETNEVPDLTDWEDITADVFGEPGAEPAEDVWRPWE